MDFETLEMDVGEDLISDLPDSILHYILSLLPSTREAIGTTILSKRWENQWTHVPVLIFDSYRMPSDQSDKDLLRLIDTALCLYDCSNINKLELCYDFQEDDCFATKLRFATQKHVKELVLNNCFEDADCYMLPRFLIENSSLVDLKLYNCSFFHDWSINWPSLKKLRIFRSSTPCWPSIGNLVSGCPTLESLEFENPNERGMVTVIASKTLKRLILFGIEIDYHMKISCPNLVELVIMRDRTCSLPVEITCPNLKSVEFVGSNFKLVNSPSLVNADLDFEINTEIEGDGENVAEKNLEQLQNVKKLTVRSWFIKALSALETDGLCYPMLNNKSLTLKTTNSEHLPGIACTLHSSPALERLIIRLSVSGDRVNASYSEVNGWNSIETNFNCLVSRLKYVEISGLSRPDAKANHVLDFIGFLLKNARVLEKLVVMILREPTTDFAYKISQKVLSFPRCSPQAIVVLC